MYCEESQQKAGKHTHKRKRSFPLVDLSDYEALRASPVPCTLRFCVPLEPLPILPQHLLLRFQHPYQLEHCLAACAQKLMESKLKIMAARVRYGLDVWNLAAQIVNPYEILPCIALRVLNRAFFKMWELIHTFPLVPSVFQHPRLLSAHLCEGPGGFVQAVLTHRLRNAERHSTCDSSPSSVIDYGSYSGKNFNDMWFAITLTEPYHAGDALNMQPMKLQDSTGSVKGHIHYGVDQSGDILNPDNISSFVEYVLQQSNGEKMHLITGDGAFDVSHDFTIQEQSHSHLVYSEVVTALRLQAHGGAFVLKLFDCFTHTTAAMVYILASLYSTVEIVRLRTSRVCNSERFIVAQGFHGLVPSLEDRLMTISAAWYKSVQEGSSAAVSVTGKLPSSFLEALAASNAIVVREEITSISRAVDVAHDLGERLSCICGSGQRRGILGLLRRKLKTIPQLRTNAYSLCEALSIPLADARNC